MMPLLLDAPARILRSFTARATLPLYELDRTHTQSKNSKVRPFDSARGFTKDPRCPTAAKSPQELRLSGWRLAHAVKKAECVRQTPFEFVSRIGFLLEQISTLDWRHGNLRLLGGVATVYADFVQSSLAGRIGQGVALLFMEREGFAFAAHYPRPAKLSGPDFVFERTNDADTRALVEAKGAFVLPGSQPNIKGALREGLDQIHKGRAVVARKSFAIGTFLRENNDTAVEPSLVAFVDPENDADFVADVSPPDWIRRHNYAAWLDAMGLHYAASDLRNRAPREHPEPLQLRIISLNGTEFGVVILHILIADDTHFFPPDFWPWHDGRCVVAGLPMPILRAIEAVLDDHNKLLASPGDALLPPLPSADWQDGNLKGSILTDGSFLWMLPARDVLRANVQEVRL